MIKLNGHLITPTVFPDKTSQVWKLPEKLVHPLSNIITWEFENEAEFLHVAQLKALLPPISHAVSILELPYLPYARQDKEISNTATFAFYPFAHLLNSLEFTQVRVFDPHNLDAAQLNIKNVDISMPVLDGLLQQLGALPVYPDAGARKRYACPDLKVLTCDKDRDPLTGHINGIVVNGTVKPVPYLIIDDICDGGRTFIEVAKKLYDAGAKEVHLYVSHGIFSKGLDVLHDAGIKRIFTRNGEVK